MLPFISINPSNGKKIQSYTETDKDMLNRVIRQSHERFILWSRTSFTERANLLIKISDGLLRERENLAQLMALEMGKPITQGLAEADKCAWVCRYYAENAEAFLKSSDIPTEAKKSYVCFSPLGVVLGIMPWNFPLWQVLRFAAPTWMAGNTIILKHAPNVSGCAEAIARLVSEAGAPQGLYSVIHVQPDLIEDVISNPYIAAVTLTGSTAAGKSVAGLAGRYLKKCVLELGGSDPYIILEDANLETAVDACVTSRLINSGQSCIAAKRFIVTAPVHDDFVEQFVQTMQRKTYGDPQEGIYDIGPIARNDLREKLHSQVLTGKKEGAHVILGGEVPERAGFFYPCTVITGVKKGMVLYHEETFGPVATIIRAENETEAIAMANDTMYGLGAAVFTSDVERGEKIAKDHLLAGSCFVNAFVRSDPRLPFGGIKASGLGRELGLYGIREFVNVKTVYVG